MHPETLTIEQLLTAAEAAAASRSPQEKKHEHGR
jgi:hypothetical protein